MTVVATIDTQTAINAQPLAGSNDQQATLYIYVLARLTTCSGLR